MLTTFIYGRLLRYGLWDKDKDEVDFQEAEEESPAETEHHEEEQTENAPPLYVSLLPILVALLLIAFGAVAEAAGLKSPVVTFFGDPVFALFVGLLGAYLLAWRTLPNGRVGEAMNQGFDATGQILLITGLGGSLGAVITETGLQDILGGFFSAEAGTPILLTILLAWFIAAVLHLAIGSISVAAITAAGILAPYWMASKSPR